MPARSTSAIDLAKVDAGVGTPTRAATRFISWRVGSKQCESAPVKAAPSFSSALINCMAETGSSGVPSHRLTNTSTPSSINLRIWSSTLDFWIT